MSVHKLPTAEEVTASVQTLAPAQKIIMDRVVKAVVDIVHDLENETPAAFVS